MSNWGQFVLWRLFCPREDGLETGPSVPSRGDCREKPPGFLPGARIGISVGERNGGIAPTRIGAE